MPVIIRILIGVIAGSIGGLITSNFLISVFYNSADVRTSFQDTVISSIGLYFGVTISLLICILLEINKNNKSQ